MSVMRIRSQRRYAMRMPVCVRAEEEKDADKASGLLIELSMDGARISGLGQREYSKGDSVELHLSGEQPMPATVCWAHDGLAGVTLDKPLHAPELSRLLETNRENAASASPAKRYGT